MLLWKKIIFIEIVVLISQIQIISLLPKEQSSKIITYSKDKITNKECTKNLYNIGMLIDSF
jgi:hypothetical protein